MWSLLDIALVSFGIDLTGGSHSDLYLVYLLQCMFMANVSYPAHRAAGALTSITVSAYVATLAGPDVDDRHGHPGPAPGHDPGHRGRRRPHRRPAHRQLLFRERATAEHEHRARLWSRVASLGRQLDRSTRTPSWPEPSTPSSSSGFEAANVCELLDDGATYRVVHAQGLPDAYVEGVHSSDRGMVALSREQRRTVVVDDYVERPDAHPELRPADSAP